MNPYSFIPLDFETKFEIIRNSPLGESPDLGEITGLDLSRTGFTEVY